MTDQELREYAMSVLSYDLDTGLFTWKVRTTNPLRVGDLAGSTTKKGYVRIKFGGNLHMAHRLAWLFVYGYFPNGQIDHKDRDKSNNRIGNLRVVTQSENQQNRVIQKNNKSGFKGVFWHTQSGKWAARIRSNGKQHHIGVFDAPEVAYKAYCEAAANLHTHNPLGAP